MNKVSRENLISLGVLVVCLLVNIALAYNDVNRLSEEGLRYYIFSDPELQKPVAPLDDALIEQVSALPGKVLPVRSAAGPYCPIIRWVEVKEVKAQTGETLYTTLDLNYQPSTKVAHVTDPGFANISILLSAVFAALGVNLVLKSGKSRALLLGGLFLLKCAALFWIFSRFDFFTLEVVDEQGHVNILRALRDLHLYDVEYQYTLGFSLLFFPVYMLTGDVSSFFFAGVCSVINFTLISTGVLALVLLIGEELGFSKKARTAGALAMILVPWLCSYYQFYGPDDFRLATVLGTFVVVPAIRLSQEFFGGAEMLGWTGLSDYPALFFGLAAVFMTLKALKQEGVKVFFFIGLIAGFSCLIRVANIFYLPAIAVMMLGLERKRILKSGALFSVAFILTMIPQGVWNYLAFGNPLLLGYKVYRPDSYAGFELSALSKGINLAGSLHFVIISLGGLCLIELCRRKKILAATVLALLSLPTLIFYSGYEVIYNPVRFLFLPITALSICLGWVAFKSDNLPQKIFCAIAVIGPFLLVPNRALAAFMVDVPAWLPHLVWGFCAIVCYLKTRDILLSILLVVYAVGSPLAAYAFLGAGFIISCYLMLRYIARSFFGVPSHGTA